MMRQVFYLLSLTYSSALSIFLNYLIIQIVQGDLTEAIAQPDIKKGPKSFLDRGPMNSKLWN